MPLPRASPCDACDARCCRTYAVHLTLADAGRLAEGLGLPLHRFAAPVPQRERTATGFLLDPAGAAHDLVLGHRQPTEEGPGCLFLEGGRCAIYVLRPRACRRFPAAVAGERVVAREGILCGAERWAGAMGRRSWRVELERERRELAVHSEVVAAWNGRVADEGAPRRFEDFADYLAGAWGWLARFRGTLRRRERDGETCLARLREILRELPGG